MKLFQHKDFEQAIIRAAEHFDGRGLRPAIIEKDYYVSEALPILALAAPDKIIFKGGTSLAKGWNLIQRFSEDILSLPQSMISPTLSRANEVRSRVA
jgi:predicted nucleotidyltransferase component of viral defense system